MLGPAPVGLSCRLQNCVSHLLNQSYFSCPFHGIMWLLKLRFEVYTHTFTHTHTHTYTYTQTNKKHSLTPRAYGPFVAFPRWRYIPWRKLCFWLTNLYNIHECENATHCNKAPCKKRTASAIFISRDGNCKEFKLFKIIFFYDSFEFVAEIFWKCNIWTTSQLGFTSLQNNNTFTILGSVSRTIFRYVRLIVKPIHKCFIH